LLPVERCPQKSTERGFEAVAYPSTSRIRRRVRNLRDSCIASQRRNKTVTQSVCNISVTISTGIAPYLTVMPFRAEPLRLTDEERDQLTQMSLSRSLPAGDVFRARLILMLAEGRTYGEIQQRLDTSAPTVSRWKQRFEESGVAGLMKERHLGRKPNGSSAK
jgi:DNA-directed RNA polymerase specialized sigma24 family protein